MKNSLKRILGFFGVFFFSILATIGMVSSTFASRIGDYANSPDNLRKILQYNRAMEACMGNSLSSFSYDNSGSGQYKVENIQKSYDRLLARRYFFNSINGTLLYSHEFERDVSQGSYDGGVWGSGNSDGKMYCGENESKVFHNAMNTFGVAETKENLKSLYCDGESSGIYTITKKKYDNNYKVIEEDSNCSTNFDLFVEYAERGEENPAYSISITVSGDPVGYYKKWFGEKVGSFSSLSSTQNEAMMYAKNRHDFMSLCGASGPFDEDPQSKNEVLVYDSATPNKKVYYTISVGMDDKFYTEINSSTQKTCVEMADGMTKEGAEAVASAPMVEVDENREEDVRACYKSAEDALKSQGRLNVVRQRPNGIHYLAVVLLDQAKTFRRNGYKVTGVQEIDAGGVTQETETIEFRDSTVEQFLETMRNNAADAGGGAALDNFIEYMTEFSNAMIAFREKSQSGGLDDNDKADFDAWVENCEANTNTFKTEVVDKLETLFNNAKAAVEGIDVNSMFRSGTVPAGESKIKDSIDNFYSFNSSNTISCILVDDVLAEYARQMAEITGGDVSMDPFQAPEHATPEDIDPEFASEEDPCYNAGIEGMSWILCPSLNNMVEATDGISGLLDSWLAIDSNLYNDTSHARTAWGYFRDMANVAVIIVLLVVIVSQVTGFGIDNYGIKKILPRLLVMAVLINLSFLICQIAIDISNLLGAGLNDMFKSIGNTISDGGGVEGVIATIVNGIFAALGIAGAGAGAAITIISLTAGGGGGPMVVIFILLMVLTALIAVLMFFLALGARFIIILVFTAIAPLAFACFILPNTQNLFKKWWNIFKTALVIYPICGALYGMSFIIRGIIFEDGNGVHLWLAMIGIAAPFLPFLILPSLTKGALAGLGVIGGALSGIGNSLKGGISKGQSALQNTASFKNAQEQSARNLNYKMAGLKFNKAKGSWEDNSSNLSSFGRFIRGGKIGMASARRQVKANERTLGEEENLMGPGFVDSLAAGRVAQRKAAEAEDVGNWETLIKDQTRDGADEGRLFGLYHGYVSSGNASAARAVARIAGRRKDTAARFMDEFTNSDFSSAESRTAAQSVAKEIAEGANSRTYLSSAPIKFDFASQINKSQDAANYQYEAGENGSGWLNSSVVDNAMSNYVTDSSELVGVKGSSLREMISLMGSGGMSDGEAKRLQILATETIANRDKGPWDSTKAAELCAMSGGAFEFDSSTHQIIDRRKGVTSDAIGGGDVLTVTHDNPTSTPVNTGNGSSQIIIEDNPDAVFRQMRRDGQAPLPDGKK